jgi:small-conductance mechanosensitive channel
MAMTGKLKGWLFRWPVVVGLCGVLLQGAHAQPASTEPAPPGPPSATETLPAVAPSRQERLKAITESIKTAETERAALAQRLKARPPDAEEKDIKEDFERLSARLEGLRTSFEELATGGDSIAALERDAAQKAVDWKQEFEDIVRPLLDELKRMTERPRAIERLRSERALYEDRLGIADRAIERIGEALKEADAPAVKKELTALQKEWHSHREDLASRLQLASVQLERLLAPQEDGDGIAAALQEFFTGRGLSLVLAVAAFALSYAVLVAIGRAVGQVWRRRYEARVRSAAKAASILYRVFVLVVGVFAAMSVLYVRGDWLILGLLILLLFGLVLALRQSFSGYLQEVRLLLNMGGVREGERVVYNAIPWRIKSLNVYSTLHNPALRGGTIRVPIDAMMGLQSRQFSSEEPWFPSREGDFVMLEGDVFGMVLLQTPEVVQLQVIGATKTYPVADYLGQRPRNLSVEGFAVPVVFGLDYRHQPEVLTTVVEQLRARLAERLETQVFRPYLKDLRVDFNEAGSSSLNLIIVAAFQGPAAQHYWAIRRFLQRTAVAACNEYGWGIPFDQLTVHMEPVNA